MIPRGCIKSVLSKNQIGEIPPKKNSPIFRWSRKTHEQVLQSLFSGRLYFFYHNTVCAYAKCRVALAW